MIFVDTGAFRAIMMPKDQHRADAMRAWDDIGRKRRPLVTTSWVIAETVNAIAHHFGSGHAAEAAQRILRLPLIRVIRPDEAMELQAIELVASL